jgi:hypothetical protein
LFACSVHGNWRQLLAKILHVDVGSEADVIGEVPAFVVRVVIDYDLIGVPIPATGVAVIVGRDAPEESVKPEALGTSSSEMPNMSAADSPVEASVFPGTVEMIVSIVAPGVMPDPAIIRVYVRSLGMSWLVAERRPVRSWSAVVVATAVVNMVVTTVWRRSGMRRGAARGNMAAADVMTAALPSLVASLLGKSCDRTDQ